MSRELDAEVAEKVMGWTDVRDDGEVTGYGVAPGEQWISRYASPFQDIPHYSTDIAAAWQVESEIERRNLWNEYVIELCFELDLDGEHRSASMSLHRMFWVYLRATPAQRCRAALKAVDNFLTTLAERETTP